MRSVVAGRRYGRRARPGEACGKGRHEENSRRHREGDGIERRDAEQKILHEPREQACSEHSECNPGNGHRQTFAQHQGHEVDAPGTERRTNPSSRTRCDTLYDSTP